MFYLILPKILGPLKYYISCMLFVSCKLYHPVLLIASQLRGLYLLAALTVIPCVWSSEIMKDLAVS